MTMAANVTINNHCCILDDLGATLGVTYGIWRNTYVNGYTFILNIVLVVVIYSAEIHTERYHSIANCKKNDYSIYFLPFK